MAHLHFVKDAKCNPALFLWLNDVFVPHPYYPADVNEPFAVRP